MPDDVAARDGVTFLDLGNQADHRVELRIREVAIAEFMAGIDDLDADRRAVAIGDAAPVRPPRMPRALALID